MNSWPAHLAVWWSGTILPCIRITVLGCCRTGSGKGCLFLSSLTDHHEGWTPSLPAHCLHFMAAASDSSTPRKSFFYALNASSELRWSAAVQIFQAGGDHLRRWSFAAAPCLCCGTFLSNYDPIGRCCVLSAPPRPRLRSAAHRLWQRHRKHNELSFRIK